MRRSAPVLVSLLVVLLVAGLPGVAAGAPAADRGAAEAGVPEVFPTPQSIERSGRRDLVVPPRVIVRSAPSVGDETLAVVTAALEAAGARDVSVGGTGTPARHARLDVWVGEPASSPAVAAALARAGGTVPDQAEGYALAVSAPPATPSVVLAGADPDGTFYAAQTLRQLVTDGPGRPRLAAVTVRDWPAMPLRGTIEGFYGSPWTHAERLDQLAFYGDVKMNTYVYAPKDDPYHRESWREPYPAEKLAELAELVEVADDNHVDFTFALSPGVSICYADEGDYQALIAKLQQMYDIGVRAFSIPLDDISYTQWNCAADRTEYGPPGRAAAGQAQVDLLNRVQTEFIATHEGTRPLQMVPTEYGDVNETAYKRVLREQLDDDVVVMWTGTDVVPPAISVADAQAFADVYGRPAFLWDNYPVNDFAQTAGRLLLAPYQKREAGLSDVLVGIVSNPMNQAAASKIALFTIADFTWNDDAYDHERSWRGALAYLADGDERVAAALLAFADLNHLAPTFGPNPWLPQAPLLAAAIADFWEAYETGDSAAAVAALRRDAQRIAEAPAVIRAGVDDDAFLSDAEPWLDATALWGQALVHAVDLLDALAEGDGDRAWQARQTIGPLVEAARQIGSTPGENRVEGVVQIGDGVLDAFLDDAIATHDRWLGVEPATNLARGAAATQSSEYPFGSYPASAAVDGNRFNFSHTAFEAQPWWQVDLGAVSSLERISVWGRTDCCTERVSNYHLLVSDTPITATTLTEALAAPGVWSTFVAETAGRPTDVPVGRTGRYVRLWLTGSTALNMAELEVYGRPAGESLSVSGAPPAAEGSTLAAAADGSLDTVYRAARAPQAGEALAVTLPAVRSLDRVLVVAQAGTATVEARTADGSWQALGSLDDGYTELSAAGVDVDAVRLVWAAGRPPPVVAEVIAWFADDAGARLTLEPAALTLEPGATATTTVVLDLRRADSLSGTLSVEAPPGLAVEPDDLDVSVARGQQRRIEIAVSAAADALAGDHAVEVTLDTGDGAPLTASLPVTVPLPTGDENLALAGTATASSVEVPQFAAPLAIDGDRSTRWASGYDDDEWLQVELAAPARAGKVVLVWEAAYATAYEVQVSADGVTWTTAAAVSDGDGGTDVVYLDAPGTRFVRMQGVDRATDYGYSLYELEVYPVET